MIECSAATKTTRGVAGGNHCRSAMMYCTCKRVLINVSSFTKALVEHAYVYRANKYMRPPFGRFTWDTLDAFAKIGVKMILWSAGTVCIHAHVYVCMCAPRSLLSRSSICKNVV